MRRTICLSVSQLDWSAVHLKVVNTHGGDCIYASIRAKMDGMMLGITARKKSTVD